MFVCPQGGRGGPGNPPWGGGTWPGTPLPRGVRVPPGGVQVPPGGYLTGYPPRGSGNPRGGTWLGTPQGSGYPRGGTWPGTPPGVWVPPGGYLTGYPPGVRVPPRGVPDWVPPQGGLGTPGGVRVPPGGYLTGYLPGGVPGPAPPPPRGGTQTPTPPGRGGTRTPPPPPGGGTQLGQHREYLLHSGRYASCVHAGGLSCCLINCSDLMFCQCPAVQKYKKIWSS